MIADVDRTLRELLQTSLGLAPEQVRFERPDADLEVGASPAVCFYLHDIRENRELRRSDASVTRRADGTATVRPSPLRYDLTYLVTVKASSAEEEHELLGLTLRALLAQPSIEPAQQAGELAKQSLPLICSVARPDALTDIGTLWSGLGGVRPAVFCTVTVPVDPFEPEERRLVSRRLLRFAQKSPGEAAPVEGSRVEQLLDVAGRVLAADGATPARQAQVSLREISRSATVDDLGAYRLGPLRPGTYTLVVSAPGFEETRREILVTGGEGDTLGVTGDLDVRLRSARAEPALPNDPSRELPARK
jgi:hypothetical protein